MIRINSTPLRKLDEIAQSHFDGLEQTILGRLATLKIRQRDFITTNLKRILVSKPVELIKVDQEFVNYCTAPGGIGRMQAHTVYRGIPKVFDYKHFTVTRAPYYCGYDLAKSLNVPTCPYCNRNYTVTVDHPRRLTRADFDHFLPKKDYKLFHLSFYNLIPSCLICNRSVKNQNPMAYGDYIHPYEEGFGTAAKFSHLPLDPESALGLSNKFSISLVTNPLEPLKAGKCVRSFGLFQIKAIYEESHGWEIADVLRRHHVSNGKYLSMLHSAFPSLGTVEELYRLAFGNNHNEDDFVNRPLSKLTKDIVEQLVFLNPLVRI